MMQPLDEPISKLLGDDLDCCRYDCVRHADEMPQSLVTPMRVAGEIVRIPVAHVELAVPRQKLGHAHSDRARIAEQLLLHQITVQPKQITPPPPPPPPPGNRLRID